MPEIDDPAFAIAFDRFADARVILIGEASHGTSEFYCACAAITRRLIERHSFDAVAIEADWPDAAAVDRHIRLTPHRNMAPPAYALQARTLLARAGLTAGVDYEIRPIGNSSLRLMEMLADQTNGGAGMNPPFSSEARLKGMRSLGGLIDLLGPYQAGGAFVMRAWAQAHASVPERYMPAYVGAPQWLANGANKAAAQQLLIEHLRLEAKVAEVAYGQLTDPHFGFTPEARIDMEGVRNMLAIRVGTERAGGPQLDPDAFLDLSYYDRAMAALWSEAWRRDFTFVECGGGAF